MPIELSAAATAPTGLDAIGIAVSGDLVAAPASPVPLEASWLEARGFAGKRGEQLAWPSAGGVAATTVVLGTGDSGQVDAEAVRLAAAALVRGAWRSERVAIIPGPVGDLSPERVGQAVAEGALLAAYTFDPYRGSPRPCRIESLVVVGESPSGIADGLWRGRVLAEATALARDLINEPPGAMTPRRLAAVAEERSSDGYAVEVWDEDRIADERLGGLLGVAAGSAEPARLVRLEYTAPGLPADAPLLAFVGKGITFDSGGLSLKTPEGMTTMKTDMSGAAAVLAAVSAIARLGVPVRVLGLMCCTENMPGGSATKPGDVLRIRNGKTIEVLNTDAEGRLVLADGLSLAVEAGASAIVDLATLTGACVVALGRRIAGLMGNDVQLIDRVRAASDLAGEPTWHLPLPSEYAEHIESDVADMKNTGAAGQAGALAAGLILQEFVGTVPWAHLDIAGPARAAEDRGYLRKGGTGFGVRTLVELATSFGGAGD